MKESPPTNVPNQGPIELQLLAIQKELSWIKNTYLDHNSKINNMKQDLESMKDAYEILKELGKAIKKITGDEYEKD